jgi:hypothetical protein
VSFAPLLGAPVLWLLALVALAILGVHGAAVRAARRGDRVPLWMPTALRILAVLGLVLPGWAIFRWYVDLRQAQELTRSLPIDTAQIGERFVANSVALLSLGFLILVTGIYLARRSARRGGPGGAR